MNNSFTDAVRAVEMDGSRIFVGLTGMLFCLLDVLFLNDLIREAISTGVQGDMKKDFTLELAT